MTGDALETIFNQLEALLWLTISLGILIRVTAQKLRKTPVPLFQWLLIPAFALFGISDLIEARTGAWWKPWWLLVIKGACILVFVLCLMLYFKNRSKSLAPKSET